jgi:hypothetical protein
MARWVFREGGRWKITQVGRRLVKPRYVHVWTLVRGSRASRSDSYLCAFNETDGDGCCAHLTRQIMSRRRVRHEQSHDDGRETCHQCHAMRDAQIACTSHVLSVLSVLSPPVASPSAHLSVCPASMIPRPSYARNGNIAVSSQTSNRMYCTSISSPNMHTTIDYRTMLHNTMIPV